MLNSTPAEDKDAKIARLQTELDAARGNVSPPTPCKTLFMNSTGKKGLISTSVMGGTYSSEEIATKLVSTLKSLQPHLKEIRSVPVSGSAGDRKENMVKLYAITELIVVQALDPTIQLPLLAQMSETFFQGSSSLLQQSSRGKPWAGIEDFWTALVEASGLSEEKDKIWTEFCAAKIDGPVKMKFAELHFTAYIILKLEPGTFLQQFISMLNQPQVQRADKLIELMYMSPEIQELLSGTVSDLTKAAKYEVISRVMNNLFNQASQLHQLPFVSSTPAVSVNSITTPAPPFMGTCYSCNEKGHLARNCTRDPCSYCKMRGHNRMECRNLKRDKESRDRVGGHEGGPIRSHGKKADARTELRLQKVILAAIAHDRKKLEDHEATKGDATAFGKRKGGRKAHHKSETSRVEELDEA